MLGELGGKLIEVVGQLDLAAQHTKRLRDGAAMLDWNQLGDGAPGALDDDLLAALGTFDQPRQLGLRFMHSDADHDRTIAGT